MRRIAALVIAGTLSACSPGTEPGGADLTAAAAPTPDPTDADAPANAVSTADPDPGGAFVIWARGDLTPEFAAAVAALPEVEAAAHVRGDTLGVTRSVAADGAVVEEHTDGFRVPVSVAAVDPTGYATTVDDPAAVDALRDLRPGTVLLTRTGADLRGVGVGGRIDTTRVSDLEVVGVIADGAVGRAEIVAHVDDAEALGLDLDGTVYLRHSAAPGAETRRLESEIEALVPADLTARIVDVRSGQERRRTPLVLSLAQTKARFGEFAYRPRDGARDVDLAPGFAEANIVTAEVPLLGTVRCHRGILADLRAALDDIASAGLGDEIDPGRYAGCFFPRRIGVDGARLSHHAWGIALDVNVDLSQPGGGAPPHPEVIAAFQRHGFRWGGDFLVPDNHHFEWVGEPAT